MKLFFYTLLLLLLTAESFAQDKLIVLTSNTNSKTTIKIENGDICKVWLNSIDKPLKGEVEQITEQHFTVKGMVIYYDQISKLRRVNITNLTLRGTLLTVGTGLTLTGTVTLFDGLNGSCDNFSCITPIFIGAVATVVGTFCLIS